MSIIIPTRDRAALLDRAIGSALSASSLAVEVVVVDDGSTDGTPERVRQRFGSDIVLLRHAGSLGRGRSRNDGLDRASGRYVKFLDDDDWLEPGALAEEAALAERTGAAIVVSGYRSVGAGEPERVVSPPLFADGVDSLLRGESVPIASALYRREVLRDVRWDEAEPVLDDWRFFLRAALAAKSIARLDRIAFVWHAHPGQGVRAYSMLDNARAFYEILDELEAELERRGEITPARRRRLAQYRYKELRVLCRDDRDAFEREVDRIRRLDPRFRPVDEERRLAFRLLARIVGFRAATLLRSRLGDARRRGAMARVRPGAAAPEAEDA